MKQLLENYFLQGEGDAWFNRNETYIKESTETDWPLFLMDQYKLDPQTILEIGCSGGWRLGKIIDRNKAVQCVGIDPSEQALASARVEYPTVKFFNGTADKIPVQEQFDLVIINFVLHWVSREKFLQSIAEIDRLVKDGGYLIIGDFSPDKPCRTAYHHLPEANLFTYKLDYPELFVSSGLYTSVAKLAFSQSEKNLKGTVPSSDRSMCALLRKSLTEFYPEVKLTV